MIALYPSETGQEKIVWAEGPNLLSDALDALSPEEMRSMVCMLFRQVDARTFAILANRIVELRAEASK